MNWARRADVVWRAVPGYLVVATIDGDVVEIYGPGSDVWSLLDAPIADTAIVAHLSQRYGAAIDEIGRDVDALLARLQDFGCVESIAA